MIIKILQNLNISLFLLKSIQNKTEFFKKNNKKIPL